ncbi:MAG TPA: hypothetical protein VM884_05455 [Flavisolibacter sp.]|nr:hypothetical protein [Flavisolibacter sp.]
MRSLFILLAAASALASCTEGETKKEVTVKGKTLITLPIVPDKVKGTYTGDFKGSPISITLNYVSHNHASGYNVHKGLTRNISGTIEAAADGLHLRLSEPGNNEYDGQFDLVIDTAKWTGKGEWKPLKKGEDASFTFKKQAPLKEEEQYGMTLMDTLGNYITLKPDGSCLYNHLPDTTKTSQQLTVRGNYIKEKGIVTVYWQKNEVFPQKSVFKLTEKRPYKDEDYVERSLKGEGKLFTEMYD